MTLLSNLAENEINQAKKRPLVIAQKTFSTLMHSKLFMTFCLLDILNSR